MLGWRWAITFLAGEEGIRQFLDIGTGLPTADNTHEVAQRIAPPAAVDEFCGVACKPPQPATPPTA